MVNRKWAAWGASLVAAATLGVVGVTSPGYAAVTDEFPVTLRVPIAPPIEVPGWSGGTFDGRCPASHPYLVNINYAPGRNSPRGVIFTANTLMGASAEAAETETRDNRHGGKEFAVKAIHGWYTNYDVHTGHIGVAMECTGHWVLASRPVLSW